MTVKRSILAAALALACIAALPSAASAQSVITGIVRDTSGAVMPGVTVEAASPALIEGVRAAVTDSNGTYRIVDLRPGIYTLKYELTGFNTQIREGFELAANFVATVNIDLTVGTLQESVTVSRRVPGGRRAEQRQAAGADTRRPERGSDGRHHSGPRPAGGRRDAERARRGRVARDAADLLRGPRPGRRPDGGAGRRHDDQRPDGRRRRAGVPQRGDDAGSGVSDGRRQRRDADRRRQHEPDSEGRRQPVPRRVQGLQVAVVVAGRQPHRRPARSGRAGWTRSTTSTSGTSSRAARSSRTSCGSSARSARRATTGRSPTPSPPRQACRYPGGLRGRAGPARSAASRASRTRRWTTRSSV